MARISLDPPATLFIKVLEWYSRRTYGDVLEPGLALGHNTRVLWADLRFERAVAKFNKLDPVLKELAVVVAAARIGCSWCMDFGYAEARKLRISSDKLNAVPSWREHRELFSDTEVAVMEYAEAMCETKPAVTDDQAARLQALLGKPAFVELTVMVGIENLRSRVNTALGLRSQGFSDRCQVPDTGRAVWAVRAMSDVADPALAVFQKHRPALFGIAYRMLGSVGDAEDVLQDAWLKWSAAAADGVDQPRAYLARMVTNASLNRLTSATVRRESYVGPWLPEPLVVVEDDASSSVERAEAVSLAMLVVLETLSPLERAVFVLSEVFGFTFGEIAGMLDRTETSVRQVASRARSHVQARRPRYEAPPDVRRRVTDEFLAACVGGDLNQVMAVLAPDVTVWTDGGGKIRAALRPVRGADHVARWFLGVIPKLSATGAWSALVNGQPGVLVTSEGVPDSVAVVDVGADEKITAIRLIRNPDKLRHVDCAPLAALTLR